MRSDRETPDSATTLVVNPLPEQSELRPGDLLRGRFVIERLLGEGGMGKVFLAVDREAERTNPFVALKVLGDRFKQHPQSLKALRREASQSQHMNHPNVVNVFFFERTEEHVFMVMEYMQGHSLDEYLKGKPQGEKLDAIWPIISGCAQGLIYIHSQKVIHSDFKPSNVFVTEKNEVKVLDLGIARSLEDNNVTDGTTRFDPDALGALTPGYASCEMFEGLTPTAQDDLYAFACVIHELLTGEHPYQRKTAVEARAELIEPKRPRGLKSRQWRALKAALAFSRGDRPADVAAFLEEFSPTKAASSRVPWFAATAAVIVALVLGGIAYLQINDSEAQYLRTTMDTYPPGGDLVSLDRAQDWLSQGEFFQSMGIKSLQSAAYDRAISQLLTDPSSALHSYRLVLARSDDGAAREQAAQGMLVISQAFRDAATELVENGGESVLVAKTVCHGLDVNQSDEVLLQLFDELSRQAPNLINEMSECRGLLVAGKVSI